MTTAAVIVDANGDVHGKSGNADGPTLTTPTTTGWKELYLGQLVPHVSCTRPVERVQLFDQVVVPAVLHLGRPWMLCGIDAVCRAHTRYISPPPH